MPTYNKGDFTQQGVDGYVDGSLELNQKRIVDVRLSSDDESETISDVNIKIRDELNDLEYDITGSNLATGENVIGGGGDETITRSYMVLPAGTYTPQLLDGYNCVIWQRTAEFATICTTTENINIMVNNEIWEFEPDYYDPSDPYLFSYIYRKQEGDGVTTYFLNFETTQTILEVKTTEDIVIGENAEITVTGKAQAITPAHSDISVDASILTGRNNETYVCFYSDSSTEIEFPLDVLYVILPVSR